MNLTVEPRTAGVAIVRMDGRLDLLAAPEVKLALADAVQAGHRRLVLDLEHVSFMDSSGLGAVVSGLKAARQAGGDLRIARPQQQTQIVLELTSLDRVLVPHASLDEALAEYE